MTDLPKPLLAALGALADVRRLPARAMTLGVTVLAFADQARREYAMLAERGEHVVAGLFGGGEVPAEVVAVPEPVVDVGIEDETDVVLDAVAHVEDPLDRPHAVHDGTPEPIPGYGGMTLGALRGKLRSLSASDLEAILTYERGHLARPPMITLVEHRLAKLAVS